MLLSEKSCSLFPAQRRRRGRNVYIARLSGSVKDNQLDDDTTVDISEQRRKPSMLKVGLPLRYEVFPNEECLCFINKGLVTD